MKINELALRTKNRIKELETYQERVQNGDIHGNLHLVLGSIEVNKALMSKLFDLHVQSCRMKGIEVGQATEVFRGQ